MSDTVFALVHDSDNFEFTLHKTPESAVNHAIDYIANNLHKTGDDENKIMNIIEFGSYKDHFELVKNWNQYVGDIEYFRIEKKVVYD